MTEDEAQVIVDTLAGGRGGALTDNTVTREQAEDAIAVIGDQLKSRAAKYRGTEKEKAQVAQGARDHIAALHVSAQLYFEGVREGDR